MTQPQLIEHLENLRALLRLAARHLAPRGWLFVTAPNIESVASRITCLFSGRFRSFAEGHYTSSGHITPLTQWQLDQIALSRLLSPLMRDAGEHDIRVCMYQQSSQGQT